MKKMLLLTVAASVSLLSAASTQEFVYTGSLQQKNFSTHEMPALNTGRSIVRPVSSVKLKRSASAVRPLADAAVLSASYKFPGYYYGYGELDDGTGYMDFLGKTDIFWPFRIYRITSFRGTFRTTEKKEYGSHGYNTVVSETLCGKSDSFRSRHPV